MLNVNDEESHSSAKILNNIILVIKFFVVFTITNKSQKSLCKLCILYTAQLGSLSYDQAIIFVITQSVGDHICNHQVIVFVLTLSLGDRIFHHSIIR